MSTSRGIKINQLLSAMPPGVVMLSSWLREKGYSPELQKRYRSSHWLESVGTGAMVRAGDHVDIYGALYALQQQAGMSVHPGGRTALALMGKAHYLEMGQATVQLFGTEKKLPRWAQQHDWGSKIAYTSSQFLPNGLAMETMDIKQFSIQLSSPPRALMECLYLASGEADIVECYQLMEGLNNLRPPQVQKLLEACNLIKVKRLFLFLAEKAGHAWLDHVDLKGVDLGSGKRSLVSNGAYIPQYQITVPKALASHGE